MVSEGGGGGGGGGLLNHMTSYDRTDQCAFVEKSSE